MASAAVVGSSTWEGRAPFTVCGLGLLLGCSGHILNLELGWQLASPGNPPAKTGVTAAGVVLPRFFMWALGFEPTEPSPSPAIGLFLKVELQGR